MRIKKWGFVVSLVLSLFLIVYPEKVPASDYPEIKTEIVWESDRLLASWFGNFFPVRIGHDGVPADWIVIRAGRHAELKVEEITVKYLDRHHRHPQTLKFYPYQRIRAGEFIRFSLRRPRQVIAVNAKVEGWSGSHVADGFRMILKRNAYGPPIEKIHTGYFYGKCIGGHRCPGYRRKHIHAFTIDLEDEMKVKRIQFFAHDRIGHKHQARINVYVDDQLVAQGIDIKKAGAVHTLDLKHIHGRFIKFHAVSDEAMIQQVTVDYIHTRQSDFRHRKAPRHDDRRRHKHPGR